MMLMYDIGDGPGEINGLQQLIAHLGMGFDNGEFDVGYFPRLAEDLGGYKYLAHIMNQSGHADPFGLRRETAPAPGLFPQPA